MSTNHPLIITRFGPTISCYDQSFPYSCAVSIDLQYWREMSKKAYEPLKDQIAFWVRDWCAANCAGEWDHHAPFGLSFREDEDFFLFLMSFPYLRTG